MNRYSGLNQLRLNLFRHHEARGRQRKSLLDPTSDYPRVSDGRLRHAVRLPQRSPAPKSGSPAFFRQLANEMVAEKKTIFPFSYDATNCHELDSSFRFRLFGRFGDRGIPFAYSLDKVAKRLGLVGFVRPFSRGAVGEIQGDAFSISDVKKWITSGEANVMRVTNITKSIFFQENTGLSRRRYPNFLILFDRRKPHRQKEIQMMYERKRITTQFIQRSDQAEARNQWTPNM